jgi:hypothetical protein
MSVGLALLSASLVVGCERATMVGDTAYRDIYKTKADCEGDWQSEGCEMASTKVAGEASASGGGGTFFYGPWMFTGGGSYRGSPNAMGLSTHAVTPQLLASAKAGQIPVARGIGMPRTAVARGGFGSTSRMVASRGAGS